MSNRKKKKNKALPMIILLILLCALAVAYVLVKDLSKEKEHSEEATETAIDLSEYSQSDVVALEYSVEDETVSLELDGNKWIVRDDERFPLDMSKIAKMTAALESLSATRTVNEGKLSDYGLDKPEVSVKVTLADGEEITYIVGNENSYNKNTYLQIGDSVYMFKDTLSELFSMTLDELILLDDVYQSTLTADSVTSISVRNSLGDEYTYDSSCEDIDTFLSTVKKYFSFKDYAGYGLTEAELSDYGIDPDGAAVVIKYKISADDGSSPSSLAAVEASLTIYCGEAEDGKCYYAVKDGSITYSIEKQAMENTLNYLIYDYPAEMDSDADTEAPETKD